MLDLFDLVAKLRLDSADYDKKIDESGERARSFGDAIKSGFGTAMKIGGAAMAAAGAAAVALTKQAVDSYADYEQLVGGIETLFGAGGKSLEEYAESVGKSAGEVTSEYGNLMSAQTAMLANASKAWKTAGLSANEYMETAIGSAAAMVNSVGGDTRKAAELTDLAITDMSDNVNKMGTSMESIQNAYRGFSRGNYTMLDNLALGFAGSKEGMEQLLEKAEELSGVKFDIESYADIVQAIHVVQGSMGITGTTAREASETISGSLSAMKSAWTNLITGFVDDGADIGELIENVVGAATTAFGNILPAAEKALAGIAEAVGKVAPILADRLPQMVTEVLPSLINTATTLVNALVGALPDILQVLIDVAPQVVQSIVSTVLGLLPDIVQLGFNLIISLAQGISENLEQVVPAVVDVILQIIDILTNPDSVDMLIGAALSIVVAIASGIISALPRLAEKVPQVVKTIVQTILNNAPSVLMAGAQLIASLLQGIGSMLASLMEKGRQLVETVKSGFMQKVGAAKQWGKDVIQNFIDGITAKWQALKDKVRGVAQTVKDFLGFSEPKEGPLSDFHTYAPDMMKLFAQGIRDNERIVSEQIAKSFDFGAQEASYTPEYNKPEKTYAGDFGGVAELTAALKDALSGMGVYIDGKYVGRLVSDYQRGEFRRGAMV